MRAKSSTALVELLGLLRPFWPILLLSVLLGIIGGLSITALLATINRSLHAEGIVPSTLLLAFGGFCLLALVGSILSDIGTNYVGQHVIARLRKELGRKIISAPMDQLERYRSHRLIPVLTHDVDTISDFAFAFAPLAVSFTISLSCLLYMAFLSWSMFLVTAVAIIIGSAIQYFARSRGIRGFFAAREQEDELQKHYQALMEGAKELRINRQRRERHYDGRLKGTADRICSIQLSAINLFVIAKGFGSTLFFIVIGVALTYESLWPSTDKGTLSGFILVLLYMKGPLESLIGNLPIVSRAQVAFGRIAELSADFSTPEPSLPLHAVDAPPADLRQGIELRGLAYRYPTADQSSGFALGPIDLHLRQGEILFIAGENGCGKTTLIKVLLGLYDAREGELLHDGIPVTAANRDAYRQLFTTVFTDYYLFDDVLQDSATLPEQALSYLARLEIGHKVDIREQRFSTTDLSTGQRKRLALLQAWLEGRPVLVFDEWAADQDPAFRRIFYRELLPEFQRLGKTIVVISHDDRYFDAADRVVHLEKGRIVSQTVKAPIEPSLSD